MSLKHTVVLEIDTGKPHWFFEALMAGKGVYLMLPASRDELRRKLGFYTWTLTKRFPGTALVFVDTGAHVDVVSEAKEMMATLPRAYLISTSDGGTAHITFDDSSVARSNEGERLIRDAERARQHVVVMYTPARDRAGDEVKRTLSRIGVLRPQFLVTDRYAEAMEDGSKKPLSFSSLRNAVRLAIARSLERMFARLLFLYEEWTHRYVSIRTRPMYAKDYTRTASIYTEFPQCAIVLQGPLLLEHDFTLETVKLYRKMFPQAHVIVSTWHGADAHTVALIEHAGGRVVESTPPEARGVYNVNLQVASAARGVETAQSMGATYVLKHRSDQRIYNSSTLQMMVNLLTTFPPSQRSGQQKRILFGHGGPAVHPYWMGEIVFGTCADIAEYYKAPPAKEKSEYWSVLPELYLPTEYLKRKGWTLSWTVEQGIEVYNECFLPLDWSMLDLYWHKYDRYACDNLRRYEKMTPSDALITFSDWLGLAVSPHQRVIAPEERFVLEILKRPGTE